MKRSKPPRRSPLSRGTAPRRNTKVERGNRLRKAREFARCYHSVERVEFVKSLPCVACWRIGFSENAHIRGDGIGRKAEYTAIVPLCGPQMFYAGCHKSLHVMGRQKMEQLYAHRPLNLAVEAARIERAWQAFSGGRAEPSGGEA